MHPTLTDIQVKLAEIMGYLPTVLSTDEPLAIHHGQWSFPGLSRSDFLSEAQSVSDWIANNGGDEIEVTFEPRLKDYLRRLEFLKVNTLPQFGNSNCGPASLAYTATLRGLREALEPVLNTAPKEDVVAHQKELIKKLRAMESRLRSLGPRTDEISAMVDRIEKAHTAADQLPTDLESLAEAKVQIDQLHLKAAEDQARLQVFRESAEELSGTLQTRAREAEAVLERCETAYSASTSVGLAAAFSERSKALSTSIVVWVVGLVAALVAGSVLGTKQLASLAELFRTPQVADSVVLLNFVMALLSVGAPIWFGWLATKQIGQRFRLAEDYAFKASISRAYEGFRREAARIDPEMEARLLASALTRFDELPLRLVEVESHGSPWHELASSQPVKEAIRAVPGFVAQVKELAANAVSAARPNKNRSNDASPRELSDGSGTS